MHQPTAQRDQLEPVALVKRSGGDQRSQLAERVAGHELGVRRAERVPASEARAEDRGLREVGALAGAYERVFADRLHGELQQLRTRALHVVAHVVGLTPLPGEQDRRLRVHPISTYAR